MQRAAQCLVTAVFVLLLNLGSQTIPGGITSLLAGENGKSPPAEPKKNESATVSNVITNSISMKLAYIPPGVFQMGSPLSEQAQFNKDNVDDWAAQEIQHQVSITNGFYMGAYAVTQEEYETVMGKNPSFFSAAGNGKDKVAGLDTRRFPVEWVSWDDATEFCKKLSQKEGKSYRLPTEAEWEYACRAGTKTAFYFGDTISTDQANYDGRFVFGNGKKGVNRERPTPTGSFPPNAFGLYDVHGSVWQWCQDWYGEDYYQKSPKNDPVNENAGQQKSRVLRGGSWHNGPTGARSAARFFAPLFSATGTTVFGSLQHPRPQGTKRSLRRLRPRKVIPPPRRSPTRSA